MRGWGWYFIKNFLLAALGFFYIRPSLDVLASLLLVLAPILWMVRAVLIYRDNKLKRS